MMRGTRNYRRVAMSSLADDLDEHDSIRSTRFRDQLIQSPAGGGAQPLPPAPGSPAGFRIQAGGAEAAEPPKSKLTWADPPPGRKPAPEWLAELKANPGRWAIVAELDTAGATAQSWRKRFKIEVTQRRAASGRWTIYARWPAGA